MSTKSRTRSRATKTPASETLPVGYRIGTVANLTGVDAHTIRAWERRYGAVKPSRSEGGSRLYDDAAVERLQLLKAFVDCGEPIGSGAHLSDDELREQLERLAGLSSKPATSAPAMLGNREFRLGLLAPSLAEQIRASGAGMSGFSTHLDFELYGEPFTRALKEKGSDVLVLEFDRLGQDPVRAFRESRDACAPALAIVVYSFARRVTLARLARAGARVIRGPMRVDQLRRALLDYLVIEEARKNRSAEAGIDLGEAVTTEAPARHFDREQLARLAEIGTGVDCECPNHLAALVSSLCAFEDYSLDCENRDEIDAALHQRLGHGTGHARAVLERLLVDLCETEGIRI